MEDGNGPERAIIDDESKDDLARRERWDDGVEKGRRSAFILIGVLRGEGMI